MYPIRNRSRWKRKNRNRQYPFLHHLSRSIRSVLKTPPILPFLSVIPARPFPFSLVFLLFLLHLPVLLRQAWEILHFLCYSRIYPLHHLLLLFLSSRLAAFILRLLLIIRWIALFSLLKLICDLLAFFPFL